MIINHNISAIFAHRQSKIVSTDLDKAMEKLSSGMRINKAADDAAGLALSEKMRAQIRGLRQAERNALDGISFIQTAEGYLSSIQSVTQRLRELAVQAANGIYTPEDRMFMQVEVSQLVDEIDRIASHAQFNGLNLLTGRYSQPRYGQGAAGSMWLHIGANMDQRERLYIATMSTEALGIRHSVTKDFISYSSPGEANMSIGKLDDALTKISKQRADLGAYQNRLEFAIKGIMIGRENITASESRIRDTDMAELTVEFTKDQILNQTGVTMLAHANMKSQLVMKLLQ